uniref:Leiomodin-1 n=1 Tax=Chelonoidis abingdonii TaxID=106734 RepID=A0A8C0J7L9_CHEAB
ALIRQVSEDPDIDSLLSTLSPEEMEELEKELDVADPDGNIPVGLRQRNQTDKHSTGLYNREAMLNYCEKETKKLIQRELSVDVSHICQYLSCKQGHLERTPPGPVLFTIFINELERGMSNSKDVTEEKAPPAPETEPKQIPENSSSKPVDSPPSQTNEEEEAASSIFDEPLERVKNNDPEMKEVNVNNSDCITSEILVRFTEALEFNTVVKVFSLANTRADDHVAFAIAIMLKSNKTLTSINLDSNHITGKGILAIFRALLQNNTLTELRFHNQRHICGGKTEMEIAKLLKENTTLLKLGYHFELAGPRMTVTNLLSRNMDKQRQKRLQEQKQVQERSEKKDLLEVPKAGGLLKASPKPSPQSSPKSSPWSSPKSSPKKGGPPAAPPPPPPPLAPPLINENIRNSLSPATQRKMVEKALPAQEKNSRDQLLAAIRSSNVKQLKKASEKQGAGISTEHYQVHWVTQDFRSSFRFRQHPLPLTCLSPSTFGHHVHVT